MSPKDDPRDKKFTFVLTDVERSMLEKVADRDQRSASDWVRFAIRKAHTEYFGTFESPFDHRPAPKKNKK